MRSRNSRRVHADESARTPYCVCMCLYAVCGPRNTLERLDVRSGIVRRVAHVSRVIPTTVAVGSESPAVVRIEVPEGEGREHGRLRGSRCGCRFRTDPFPARTVKRESNPNAEAHWRRNETSRVRLGHRSPRAPSPRERSVKCVPMPLTRPIPRVAWTPVGSRKSSAKDLEIGGAENLSVPAHSERYLLGTNV